MPDFSQYQIIWCGGHGLERSEERRKIPPDVEKVIRSVKDGSPGRKNGRWELLGCIEGEWTRVIVQVIGEDQLCVVTMYGEGKRCR